MAYMTISYCTGQLSFTIWIVIFLDQPFLVFSSLHYPEVVQSTLHYPEVKCVPLHPLLGFKNPLIPCLTTPGSPFEVSFFSHKFSKAMSPCIPLPRQKNLWIYFLSNLTFVQPTGTPPWSFLILFCAPMRCFVFLCIPSPDQKQTIINTTTKPVSPYVPSQDRKNFSFSHHSLTIAVFSWNILFSHLHYPIDVLATW